MSLILDGTNGLSDVDGTAATPAIRGTDTNTGIFFPAADTIAFAEGGTEVARFDSSGNLGVGYNNPSLFGRFVVQDSGSGGGTITAISSTASNALYIKNTGTEARFSYNDAYPMTFATNSTERMRIDSSGNLLVGTTGTPSGSVGGAGFIADSNSRRLLYLATTSSSDQGLAFFINTNGAVGSIRTSGSGTSYVTTSDYRLKENVAPMTGALAKVSQLKPVTYKWKVDGSDGQGFIAHEIAEVVPDAVSGEKDAVHLVDIKDEEGNVIGQEEKPVYQGIDTSFLVATLTAAIQELKSTVDAQAARIAALENPPVESVTNE